MTERVIVARGKISPDYRCKGIVKGKRMRYSGKVRLVHSLDEAVKSIEKGDILVAEDEEQWFSPDAIPTLKKTGAVILNKGPSEPSNLSIVCRELGVVYVSQTGNSTRVLEEGKEYTIQPTTGAIYGGRTLKRFYSGKVRVIHSLNEATRSIQRGDVLVAEDISETEKPKWMPMINKAKAVVLNKNDPESELGIACRKLGIPFVTQTGNATDSLEDGQEYTIDCETGAIFRTTTRWDG
jgi:phosphohistidine swiveling domain-containing protein